MSLMSLSSFLTAGVLLGMATAVRASQAAIKADAGRMAEVLGSAVLPEAPPLPE